MLNKGVTPTERRLVFRNLHQHEEIRSLTERLTEAVRSVLAGQPRFEADFVELLAEYLGLQRRHMNFEETQLFPLLEATFDNDDWGAVTATSEPEQDNE